MLFLIFKHLWHNSKNKKSNTITTTTADLQSPVTSIQTPAEIPQASIINTAIPQDDIYRIVQEVEDMPPLQIDDLRKHYIGLNVDWLTEYQSAYKIKKDDDLIRVTLMAITKSFRPICVCCEISLSDYKQFSILKREAKVRITGTISKFDSYSFELSNVKLYFQ